LAAATLARPSLTNKHVTMHTLRHTAAMNLLAAGVDVAVIALWLGHADTHSTDAYLHEGSGIASDGRESAGCLLRAMRRA
ncbi:MAG: tyrosine-type recombinase/integrase, partial [Thermocrispum sp.]